MNMFVDYILINSQAQKYYEAQVLSWCALKVFLRKSLSEYIYISQNKKNTSMSRMSRLTGA